MSETKTIQPLSVGHSVRFFGDRRWWTVQAGDDRFTILTRQAAFKPKGEIVYTIIDRQRALRGPCNLIGQGWDFDTDLTMDAEALLRALRLDADRSAWFEENKHTIRPGGFRWPAHLDPVDDDGIPAQAVEVSHRNNVLVRIEATR